MTSKNGSEELVSLLQYMKETRIDNPEIIVKDSRILELDEIVTEVKESEEWETVKMNILEIGITEGARQKLSEIVAKMLKKGLSVGEIAEMLEEKEDDIRELAEQLKG